MPDPIERKRLKKKMLDRWENEGGRIAAESADADDTRPTSERERKDKQVSLRAATPRVAVPRLPQRGEKLPK